MLEVVPCCKTFGDQLGEFFYIVVKQSLEITMNGGNKLMHLSRK